MSQSRRIWKGDFLIADFEELEKLDASEIYRRRLNAKEVLITYKDGEFVFSVADGSTTLSRRDYEFQEPTLRREPTVRRENLSGESQGVREELTLKKQKMTRKLGKTSGLFKEISFIVIILNREFNFSCRKKNHSLFHWSILMWSGQLTPIWNVAQEKRVDDHWNVDGNRNLSDAWTGFTRLTLLNETPPKGHTRSGERPTKIQTTSRPDHKNWKSRSKKRKTNWWQEEDEFIFPVEDGTVKLSGRDYEFPEPTLRLKHTVKSEDSTRWTGRVSTVKPSDDAEDRADFWSIHGDFIYRHHNEPRVQLYVPKEEPFPIPLTYIDVTRSISTDLDVLQEKRIDDFWNVDSNRHLLDSRRSFTKFTLLKEQRAKGYMWSGEKLTNIQLTTRPDHVWPEVWTKIGKAGQNRELAEEKPKLDKARRLRGIYFIDPEDEKIQGSSQKCEKKTGKTYGTSHTLLKSFKLQHENIDTQELHPRRLQKRFMVVYSGISWIHMATSWIFSTKKMMKSTLRAKDLLRWHIAIWYTSCLMKTPECKSSSGRSMGRSSKNCQHG